MTNKDITNVMLGNEEVKALYWGDLPVWVRVTVTPKYGMVDLTKADGATVVKFGNNGIEMPIDENGNFEYPDYSTLQYKGGDFVRITGNKGNNKNNALLTLDLSNFDTSAVTSMGSMFSSCRGLTNLEFGHGCKTSISFSYSPLTNTSAMSVINGLDEVSATHTVTFKATTYDTLTEEQIALATSKGWTVARG